jgi:hypothetical protein
VLLDEINRSKKLLFSQVHIFVASVLRTYVIGGSESRLLITMLLGTSLLVFCSEPSKIAGRQVELPLVNKYSINKRPQGRNVTSPPKAPPQQVPMVSAGGWLGAPPLREHRHYSTNTYVVHQRLVPLQLVIRRYSKKFSLYMEYVEVS